MEDPAKFFWYTIKSILLAPLDLRWCKCIEKIFFLAIFSDVMFAICSSSLGCCTNWSNIMILNAAYLAFVANRKILFNLAYLVYLVKGDVPPRDGQWVLSELHWLGSPRTHKPRFWPRFSQRATGDIWFSIWVTDDIWYIICQTDGSSGKLVRLSEPPCILHWSSFEYWCQWTIWQVVALVDNDMPLTLSSVSLSMKISISGKWCLFWAIRRQCFAPPSFSSLPIFQLW